MGFYGRHEKFLSLFTVLNRGKESWLDEHLSGLEARLNIPSSTPIKEEAKWLVNAASRFSPSRAPVITEHVSDR